MSTENQVLSPHWPSFNSLHKIITIILALLLLLLWLLGYGPGGSKCAAVADCDYAAVEHSNTNAVGVVVTGGAATGAANVGANADVKGNSASMSSAGTGDVGANATAVRDSSFLDYEVPEYQLVGGFEATRIYFATDSYDLTEDDNNVLATAYQFLENDLTAVAVVSGFHDPSGDLLYNQELAKKRAVAVRDAMIAHGISEERVVLEKPFQTEGTGNDEEARRVEITIAHLR